VTAVLLNRPNKSFEGGLPLIERKLTDLHSNPLEGVPVVARNRHRHRDATTTSKTGVTALQGWSRRVRAGAENRNWGVAMWKALCGCRYEARAGGEELEPLPRGPFWRYAQEE